MADTLEIIELSENRYGWRQVRLALNGKLACPLDISEERYRFFADQGDVQLRRYLCQQAAIAIRAFGDYRYIRRREDGEYVRLDAEDSATVEEIARVYEGVN